MRIAGKYTDAAWVKLRPQLEEGDAMAWSKAVNMLRQRLSGRFLDHARALLDRPYSGFAVLALDCTVIEALVQFREGLPETKQGAVHRSFIAFLTTSRFAPYFTKAQALSFYKQVRCGILHQAETKGASLVRRSASEPVVRPADTDDGLVLNARRFHEELEAAFEDYLADLLKGNAILRSSFIKKMNYITRQSHFAINDKVGASPPTHIS